MCGRCGAVAHSLKNRKVALLENGSCNISRMMVDAAAAIEELQAEVKQAAKRNAELHAELERWVSAAEKAGEPKRGELVRVEDEESYHYECSECGERPLYSRYGDVVLSEVCHNCGADMRKMEVQE